MRQQIIAITLTIATAFIGCKKEEVIKTSPVPPIPKVEQEVVEKKSPDIPRTIEVTMNLSSSEDLKIKSGQVVKKGQILSDRISERRSLLEKKKLLEISMEQISKEIPSPQRPLDLTEMPKLPPANFDSQVAAIERGSLSVSENQRLVKLQELVVDQIAEIGSPDAVQHEKSKLDLAKIRLRKSQVDLKSAEASLSAAKSARNHTEYLYDLEFQNRNLELQKQQLNYDRSHSFYLSQVREQEFNKASVGTQLASLEEKINQLTAVKSPFSGKIRKVKYDSQNNGIIVATAVIDVNSSNQDNGSGDDSATLFKYNQWLSRTSFGIGNGKFPRVPIFEETRSVGKKSIRTAK